MGEIFMRMQGFWVVSGAALLLAACGGGSSQPEAPETTSTQTDVIVDETAPADESAQDMMAAMPETEAAPMDPMAQPAEAPAADAASGN